MHLYGNSKHEPPNSESESFDPSELPTAKKQKGRLQAPRSDSAAAAAVAATAGELCLSFLSGTNFSGEQAELQAPIYESFVAAGHILMLKSPHPRVTGVRT